MNKLVLLVVMVLLASTAAFAGEYGHQKKIIVIKKTYIANTTNVINVTDELENNRYGAMLDMPNLVRLNKDWTIGAEGGKDLNYTNASEGWFTFAKVTYSGTLLNLNKGE